MCDGAGSCVECIDPDDCDPSGECYEPTCNGNTCDEDPKAEGDACTGGVNWVCDGGGACVQCTPTENANCNGSTQVCRSNACVGALHSHGWEDATDTTSSPFTAALYWFRLPALTYDATLLGFGIKGGETGASFKLALYADNGSGTGASGAPFAFTTSALAISGATATETTSITSTTTALNSGTIYWLAFKGNATKLLRARVAAQEGFIGDDSYSNAFPTNPHTLANVADEDGVQYAVYIRVRDTE
jgi:hypothetical protein